jgi:rubrerythrin
LQFLKKIRVTQVENRPVDYWYDLNSRQLRSGEVSFYRVRDFFTGDWLFKTCNDKELDKLLVKAVKCPAGSRFAQLEGNSMIFQKSRIEGMLYDVVSLTQVDENEKLSRKLVSRVEEIPATITKNYEVKTYEEATGKTALGKHLVTLCKREDKRAMVILFLLERAWPLSASTPAEKLRAIEEPETLETKFLKKEIDTGQVWACPICGKQHRLVHVEKDRIIKHALRKHP